jgi:broad specificity phosphatase PhoE
MGCQPAALHSTMQHFRPVVRQAYVFRGWVAVSVKTIYLVRHGQPVSVMGRCLGQTNTPLDEVGLYQASRLREWFADKPLAAICTSPLERCVQTARIISDGRIPVDQWPSLVEMNVGRWENLSFNEIRRRYPKEYEERGKHLGTVAPPEGESIAEAGARFGTCLRRLAGDVSGDFAVVGHAGAISGFLCPILGIDPDMVFSIRQPYGALSVLHWDESRFVISCVGLAPDLCTI